MNLKIFLHYYMYMMKESETILKHGCLVSSLFLWCGGGGLTKCFFFPFCLLSLRFKGDLCYSYQQEGCFLALIFLSGVKGSSFRIVLRRF